MNLEQQAKNVAAQGRYGDSMIMHVNPAEVKGLAQAMPHMITVNPKTNQPEAFLPFLAPIFGSMLGSTLFTGLNPLVASALGSGLAQTAVTGDIKKGFLAGLTGWGFGKALQGAGAAAAGTEAAATQSGALERQFTDLLTQQAGQHANAADFVQSMNLDKTVQSLTPAGQEWLGSNLTTAMSDPSVARSIGYAGSEAGKQYLAGNPTLGQAFSDAGGFSKEGFKNLLSSASDPMTMLPIAGGMAPTAIMESQEQFEADIARRQREREEERERNWRENPEMIPVPVASGGKLKLNTNNYFLGGGIDEIVESVGRGIRSGDDLGSYTGQGYVQERTPMPIDPYFQAGFQPEMSYFQTLNPPASEIGGPPTPELPTNPPSGETGTGGSSQEEMRRRAASPTSTALTLQRPPRPSSPTPTRFDPTQTAGYQSFYGDAAQDVIPHVVDPYAPLDFSPPPRLPSPIMPPTPPIGPILQPEPPVPPIPPVVPPVPVPPVVPPVTDPVMPTPKGSPVLAQPLGGGESGLNALFGGFENGQGASIPELSIPESLLGLSIPQLSIPEMSSPPEMMSVDEMEELEDRRRPYRVSPTDRAKGGTTNYQEGRETQINMDDPVVQGVINFLLGNSSDESIIPQFIEIYGVEAFQQLRRQVLNEVVPQAQTEGQIQGSNQGGMADDIGGMIGNKERVAVSQDEYIVPADVVSMLGDGSSDSGAAKLDTMLDRVRQAKTGRTTQAAPLKKDVLPA